MSKTTFMWLCVTLGVGNLGFMLGWFIKARLSNANSDLAVTENAFVRDTLERVRKTWVGIRWFIYNWRDQVKSDEYTAVLNLAEKMDKSLDTTENKT